MDNKENAIPVSFVRKKINEYKNDENYMMLVNAFALKKLLEDWRENCNGSNK